MLRRAYTSPPGRLHAPLAALDKVLLLPEGSDNGCICVRAHGWEFGRTARGNVLRRVKTSVLSQVRGYVIEILMCLRKLVEVTNHALHKWSCPGYPTRFLVRPCRPFAEDMHPIGAHIPHSGARCYAPFRFSCWGLTDRSVVLAISNNNSTPLGRGRESGCRACYAPPMVYFGPSWNNVNQMFSRWRVAVASACHFVSKKAVLESHTEAVEKRHGQPIAVASGSPSFLSDRNQYFHTCSRRRHWRQIGADKVVSKARTGRNGFQGLMTKQITLIRNHPLPFLPIYLIKYVSHKKWQTQNQYLFPSSRRQRNAQARPPPASNPSRVPLHRVLPPLAVIAQDQKKQ